MIREIPQGFRSLFTGLARFYLLVWHPLWSNPAFLTQSLTWLGVLPFTQVSTFPRSPLSVLSCSVCRIERDWNATHYINITWRLEEQICEILLSQRFWWQSTDKQSGSLQPTMYIKLEKPWDVPDPLFLDIFKHSSLLGRGWSEVQWLQHVVHIQRVSIYSNTKQINSIAYYENFWLITEKEILPRSND